MYFLSVAAMFRNESHCIKEWIEHYLNQDVDHFYLINDDSTDNFMEIIQPYIDNKLITLYTSKEPQPHQLGYQMSIYNKYLLPHLYNKDTKWLLICDLDEFVWSPGFKTLKNVIKEHFPNHGQIQIPPTIFASNNLEKQPKSLVQGFTKRSKDLPSIYGSYKYIVNSDFKFTSLNVHHATFENKDYERIEYFIIIIDPYFRLNHYICQSKEFWLNVKCTRGDSDGYMKRDIGVFEYYCSFANETDDFDLANINININ